MNFKHKGGTVNINKKLLATYSDEQLQEFAKDNGIAGDEIGALREKVGESDAPEQPKGMTTQNTVGKKK